VYALGAIFYECLTGRPPFKGTTPMETIQQVLDAEPVSPARLQPGVPRDLDTICLKCLEKEPAKRYATAAALADDLERYLAGQPIRARRTPLWERGVKWTRRHPARALATAVSIAVVLGLVGGGLAYDAQRRERERLDYEQLDVRRAMGEGHLNEGQEALARDELETAQSKFERARDRLGEEPRLAALHVHASRLLAVTQERIAARQAHDDAQKRYQQFVRQRDEALFYNAQFTGLEGAANVAATRKAASTALDQFAVPEWAEDRDKAFALACLPGALSVAKQDQIRSGCYELLLVLAEAEHRPAQALRLLDQAAALRPSPTRAYHLARAACLSRVGDASAADRARAEAEAVTPASASDHFLVGLDAYKRAGLAPAQPSGWSEAIREFHATRTLQEDHFWAHFLLALCYLRCQPERPSQAWACLTVCCNQQPKFGWTYLMRGLAASEWGNQLQQQAGSKSLSREVVAALTAEAAVQFRAAEEDYRRVLDLHDPTQPPLGREAEYILLVNRATLRQHQGRLPEAVADLQAAMQLRPGHYNAYLNLADVYQQQGRWDDARTQLAAVERLGPTLARDFVRVLWARDHTERGRRLHQQEKYTEALEAFDTALRLVDSHLEARRLRLQTLLELKRHQEVLQACDDYYRAHGAPAAEIDELRGLARAGRKDFAGAIGDYTRALAQRADSAVLYAYRGWAYLLSEAPKVALADFDSAVHLQPEHADAYAGRGQARIRLGEYRQAVADASKAVDLAPKDARMLYHAAQVLLRAATAARADPRLPDRTARDTGMRYEARAQQLFRAALDLMPPERRAALRGGLKGDGP
jgi:Tfp pilus assembly protein PilF